MVRLERSRAACCALRAARETYRAAHREASRRQRAARSAQTTRSAQRATEPYLSSPRVARSTSASIAMPIGRGAAGSGVCRRSSTCSSASCARTATARWLRRGTVSRGRSHHDRRDRGQREEAEREQRAARGDTEGGRRARTSEAAGAHVRQVRLQPHECAPLVDRHDRCADIMRLGEHVPAPAHAAPDLHPEPAVLLPHDSIREAPLDRQAFLPLHPRVERRQHLARHAVDHAGCDHARHAGESRQRPDFLGQRDARALLGQGLAHVVGRQADFFGDLEQAILRDLLAGLNLTRPVARLPARGPARAPTDRAAREDRGRQPPIRCLRGSPRAAG